jgi:hypothetical protein
MSRWHVGQEVVCVKDGEWVLAIGPAEMRPGPKHREDCVIDGVEMIRGKVWLHLVGYGCWYYSAYFRPKFRDKTQFELLQRLARDVRKDVPALSLI